MKRNPLLLSIAIVALLSCVFSYLFKDKESTGEGVEIPEQDLKEHEEEKTDRVDMKNRIRARMLQKSLEFSLKNSEQRSKDEDKIDRPQMVIDLSDDEIFEFAEMTKKTSELYWNLAPVLLEDIWENENPDRLWNVKATKSIRDIMEEETMAMSDSELLDIDCRDSLCKVQLRFSNDDSLDNFKQLWAIKGPVYGQDFGNVERSDENLSNVTIYFSKEREQRPFFNIQKKMVAMLDED